MGLSYGGVCCIIDLLWIVSLCVDVGYVLGWGWGFLVLFGISRGCVLRGKFVVIW